jgi:chemotaxis protein CheD
MIPEKERAVHVMQGDFAVSEETDVYLTTVLGSCVAVCLYDSVRGIGGLNHFLLPGGTGDGQDSLRYGAYAMELLINALLRKGAERARLQAKVFGGARMTVGLRDIGGDNANFAKRFLSDEGIPITASDLLGRNARRVRFWPVTGRAKLLRVDNAADVPPTRITAQAKPPAAKAQDNITLF